MFRISKFLSILDIVLFYKIKLIIRISERKLSKRTLMVIDLIESLTMLNDEQFNHSLSLVRCIITLMKASMLGSKF